MARKAWAPNAEQREAIKVMIAGGIAQNDICAVYGITGKTLRKHCKEDIAAAGTLANAKVIATAYKMATGGKIPAATFFWLKCRAGWNQSPDPLEDEDAPAPVKVVVEVTDARKPRA